MNSRYLLLVCSFAIACIFCATSCDSSQFTTVSFPGGKSVRCEIAMDQKELVAGLSTYETLDQGQGMLFAYPVERSNLSFWMPARMNFPIDMLFLDSDKRVVYIVRNAQPCESNIPSECPSYGPPPGIASQYVVEVVAGFCDKNGIKANDQIEFNLP